MPEFGYIVAATTSIAIAAIAIATIKARRLMPYSFAPDPSQESSYEKARKLYKQNVGLNPGSRSKTEIDYVNSFY